MTPEEFFNTFVSEHIFNLKDGMICGEMNCDECKIQPTCISKDFQQVAVDWMEETFVRNYILEHPEYFI